MKTSRNTTRHVECKLQVKPIALALACLLLPATGQSSPFDIANVPLDFVGSIEPNLMYLHDDSGSMTWGFTPDTLVDGNSSSTGFTVTRPALYSSDVNFQYYNPRTTYHPPLNHEGLPFTHEAGNPTGDADFYAAWIDPFRADRNTANSDRTNTGASNRNRVNLSSNYAFALESTNWDAQRYYSSQWFAMRADYTMAVSNSDAGAGLPAYYYTYNGPSGACPIPITAAAARNTACFTRHVVSAVSGIDRGDGMGTDERKNFANWFSFYRVRSLMAKTVISRAFAEFGGNIRLGYGRFNKSTNANIDGKNVSRVEPHVAGKRSGGVRPFTNFPGTAPAPYTGQRYREWFYDWLFDVNSTGGTPTNPSLDAIGQYFENGDTAGPWSATPGFASAEPFLACRKSYVLVLTDGKRSDERAGTVAARANVDGSVGATIAASEGNPAYTYAPVSPFMDNADNYMADVAMYYWVRDLLPGTPNRVPRTAKDPAFWQHMNTFTVGMGIESRLNKSVVFSAIDNPDITVTWPTGNGAANGGAISGTGVAAALPAGEQLINPNGEYLVDDLMHGAVNGRGDYFSARNPEELAVSITSIVRQVNSDTSSGSKPATPPRLPVGETSSSASRFSITFDPEYWSSKITNDIPCSDADVKDSSLPQCAKIGDTKSALWSTAAAPTGPAWADGRNIYTLTMETPPTVVPFKWASLSGAQQALLAYGPPAHPTNAWLSDGEQVLNYLRGNTSNEGELRYRKRGGHRLGDITTSDPIFVGQADDGWSLPTALSSADQTSYQTFRTSLVARPEMIYVGANDGMLHGYRSLDGDERFAYIPRDIFPKLKNLADPAYTHEFYADSGLVSSHAIVGSDWKNVLVGSTGAGGRAYYTLDITKPDAFGAGNVKWEFTDDDLGFNPTAGKATIAHLASGEWVAIFGNGINSLNNQNDVNHTAQLFVVNLDTGALIKKIDTGIGDISAPNGLSAPRAFDFEEDGVIDLVYAGDMRGNLWRFDLSDADKSKWSYFRLLQATDSGGAEQPVSARPTAVKKAEIDHPGVLVYIGTGKLFEPADADSKAVQTLYGVLDECAKGADCTGFTTAKRATLQEQSILPTVAQANYGSATNVASWKITDNSFSYDDKQGWYMDLSLGGAADGWRVLSEAQYHPIKKSGYVEFAARALSKDPCAAKVDGLTLNLDPRSGGYVTNTILGDYSVAKLGMGKTTYSMGGKGDFISPDSALYRPCLGALCDRKIEAECDNEVYVVDASGNSIYIGKDGTCSNKRGRQSWRQLR